ncbi:hypothetical protein MHK_007172, partial [Candidatus Magnetomorum sp. HK-1]
MIAHRLSVIMIFCFSFFYILLIDGGMCLHAKEFWKAPNFKKYNTPDEVIKKYKDNYNETNMINPWIVFADRDSVNIYKTKSLTKKIAQANFLDRFMVKNWVNDSINIEQQGNTGKKIEGWANIKQFMLLSQACK